MRWWLMACFCAAVCCVQDACGQQRGRNRNAPVASELDLSTDTLKIKAKDFAPMRKDPRFKGVFSVGLILIHFPDTQRCEAGDTLERLSVFGGMPIEEYYKNYSQGITWPEILIVNPQPYMAPQPLGYYCAHDYWTNPLGYKDRGEGNDRAAKLKRDAEQFAFRGYRRPSGIPLDRNGKPQVIAHVYENRLQPIDDLERLIRPRYPTGLMLPYNREKEAWTVYKPQINWSDPLWPNSSVQILNQGDGGTLCHELGHVLGAPDFYHASEPHDGLPGTPSLPWAFGPTGPGYCRVIYQAFLPPSAYPMITRDGTYTLHPRNTNPAEKCVLGAFIPSAHPNYLFCLEYVKDEKKPLGNPGENGLLIQVINVTLKSPLFGPPDLCYVYRPNDPFFRGEAPLNNVLFGEAHNRPVFNMESDPPARLPNLLDSGIALEDIVENDDGTLSFTLKQKSGTLSGMALKESLLPKIRLDEVTEILSNGFYAKASILFRGEPLNVEYGFCWETFPKPTYKRGKVYPLYHRDRYSARITGLRPNTTYYVRAYIRSALGITYSEEELKVKTLPARPIPDAVPVLLDDQIDSRWVVTNGLPAVAIAKLSTYYRVPMDPEERKPAFDYSRLHSAPTKNRPEFRMTEFRRLFASAMGLSGRSGLAGREFTKNFDKKFSRAFGYRPKRGEPAIEALTPESISRLTPLIQAQLADARPLLVIQKSQEFIPVKELTVALIDGYDESEQFHIVYPAGRDRTLNRRTGWHPLSVLLESTEEVRIVFGLVPPSFGGR